MVLIRFTTLFVPATPLWLFWLNSGTAGLIKREESEFQGSALPQYVFRMDDRSPEEIRAQGGFWPQEEYENHERAFDVMRHINGEAERRKQTSGTFDEEWKSAYISTSRSREASYSGRWCYQIHTSPNMIDTRAFNATTGEVLGVGVLHWSQVMGFAEIYSDYRVSIDQLRFFISHEYNPRWSQYTLHPNLPQGWDNQHARQSAINFMNQPGVGAPMGWTGRFPLVAENRVHLTPTQLEDGLQAAGVDLANVPSELIQHLKADQLEERECNNLLASLAGKSSSDVLHADDGWKAADVSGRPNLRGAKGAAALGATMKQKSCGILHRILKPENRNLLDLQRNGICRSISGLKISFQLSNAAGSETFYPIVLTFGLERRALIVEQPSSGFHKWKSIDMERAFGQDEISVDDFSRFSIESVPVNVPYQEDQWKLEGKAQSFLSANRLASRDWPQASIRADSLSVTYATYRHQVQRAVRRMA
ncbi:putative enterotoxin [Cordyceps sp. RAO-2017]|nr:putative enterotoxin [Cordyceps sp. RAO-2017]